jgi:general stress protein 26
MTVPPPDDLDTLADRIVRRLVDAADRRQGAWRTPVLSTLTPDGPTARVIVVRSLDADACALEIFTDARSAKVVEIAADPRVALTFWDPQASEQLRMTGEARAVTDPAEIADRWQAIGATGQALYDGDPGRFVVLEVVWTAWDWLWIGAEPHRRATFTWASEGGRDAAWTAP